ncbi:ROK family protein [Pelagibacterium sp.]|uniref:ROK family protein n=1 Tax=Pelagibacterium sp. TaxID=1967288 RepID=UPI003A92DC73
MTLTETRPYTGGDAGRTIGYCVDIGGSFIKFGRAYGPGLVRVEDQVPTPIHSWHDLKTALADLISRFAPQDDGLPLAICTTGLFDVRTGVVTAANIPCFAGHDIVGELSAHLVRKVLIANDADSFALAEATVGAGKGHDVVMSLILGTGVGGGLVVDGNLVQGPGGVTGEWGHGAIVQTQVTLPDGERIELPRFQCGCGQLGCTDTIGGARGIERIHKHLTDQDRTSRQIVIDWGEGQQDAARTMAVYFELLAEPLAFIVNIVGTTVMPVGGGLATSAELVAGLDKAVRARTLNAYGKPLIVPGHHLKDGGLVGVSVLAAQHG